jgi:hypothetical protein
MQPSLLVIEPLAHDRLLQNMKRLERRGDRPGSNFLLRLQLRKIPNLDRALGRFRNFRTGDSHLLDLLVKEGGEKKELRLTEAKPVASFRDTAFAQQDRLLPPP